MPQLPKIALPKNTYDLPESGEKVSVRPLTGQEFELMLAAQENKDPEYHLRAMYELIDAVVVQPPEFESRDLSPVDFDFIFTKMMITSYGKKTIDFKFQCKNMVESDKTKSGEKECGTPVPVTIDLEEDVEFEESEEKDNEIMLDGRYKIILQKVKSEHTLNEEKNVFRLAASLIDRLVDTETGDEWHFTGPQAIPKKEIEQFANESLYGEPIKKIGEYYRSKGRMTSEISVKCKGCGHEHNIKLRGFMDFFGHASPGQV